MPSGRYHFEDFVLDPDNRELRRAGAPVDLNGRYFDALTLLVREHGRLVTKERFLDEVWRGVPVTDEALTQCIRTLRRQLGDNAAVPRFIETVPKHGYRFIASPADDAVPTDDPQPAYSWRDALVVGGAATLGAGVAGLLGGLFYGLAGAWQPTQTGMGTLSVLIVLIALTIGLALIGGAGVGFGIAATGFARDRPWRWAVIGGALGGLAVGGVTKLLGLDAFHLLFGRAPADFTGATEGILLGAAVGFAVWFGSRSTPDRLVHRSLAAAAAGGAAVGVLIPVLGGRLLGGSLDLLTSSFPDSRLRLDRIGAVFGEPGFGQLSQIVTGGLEGMLFAVCVVGATVIAWQSLRTAR